MSNIVLYRLTNGDELIADEVASSLSLASDVIVISDAVALVYHQTEKGVSVGFAPFMPQSDGNIKLYKSDISATSVPNEQVLKEYNRIFSKIEIVPAGTIIT
jgi:hypothetical protein